MTAAHDTSYITAQSGTSQVRGEVVEKLRVEGNVIHLPKPVGSDESATTRTTMRAGSGWIEPSKSDDNPLRNDETEVQRSTLPPEPVGLDEGEATEVSGEIVAPATPERVDGGPPEAKDEPKADEPSGSKSDEPKAETGAPVSSKAAETQDVAVKGADTKRSGDTKRDPVIARGERRDRKESLSTHLSDEAKAFFSDKSLEAAYKPHHDNFEDLTPAHEDHAHEMARSRKWMRVTGLLLVGVVAVIGAFALQSRYGVQETVIRTSQFGHGESATAAPTTAAPETAAPTTAAPETAAPETAAPETAAPTTAAPTTAAPALPAPTPAAVPSSAEGVAALLVTARRSNQIDAWEAYFNAAPTEDRLMASTAMAFAERGRNADAERLALRAVTANPENGQGWFVLAAVRNSLRNREGSREARQRCIALGGRWANECRGI